jgi:hypothetical protein
VLHEPRGLGGAPSSLIGLRRLPSRQSLAGRTSPTQVACALTVLSMFLASCGAPQNHARSEIMPSPGFEVFGGSPTSFDTLPTEIAATLSRSVKPEFGRAEIADARRVLANDPGWLLPAANGEICLVQLIYPLIAAVHGEALPPTPVTSCEPEALAEAGRLVGTHSLGSSVTRSADANVTGIAPNGVATVKIIASRGRSVTVDVVRNAYEAVIADPVAVRFIATSHRKAITHAVRLTTFSGGARHVEG